MANFYGENILYNSTVLNFESKQKIYAYNYFKQKILLTISATENFLFEIENSRIVENTFPEKVSRDL